MKTPVCRKVDYTIYFELVDGVNWLHCDIRKWTPAVKRELSKDSNTLYELHGGPWFAVNEPHGCKKHQKFMELMGFTYACDVQAKAGGNLHVYRK